MSERQTSGEAAMTPSEIIDALGGTFRVAELCEVKPPSVSDWRKRGIPRARLMFLRIAKPEVFAELDAKAKGQECRIGSAVA
ncbi:helix-turn-helix domain-containing protein [Pseudomonas aeruginosa]|uniref:helix-turn-helix domain-containing protein n=1 Tax=Pseudomonas aeruginosa TaxID=287 RepID=UPI001FCC412B|nr:helix-turn-helix domain-containing protein [Pseudomonas aeruginosa]MDI2387003.1 helix-turn-helix domain-containing protein [Pseudomonas aeruginosa]